MSFSEASGIITQTGIDTNLSGLSGVLGVVVVDNGSHKTYHLDGKKLRIDGVLTIDPQVECLLFEQQDLDIYGTLNFGVTSLIGGATRYSRAIGLISHDTGYARFLVQSGGTLNWNGGAMKLNGGCDFKNGSNVSITNGIIIATNSAGQRLRMNTANCSVDGLSIDGNLRFDVFKTFVSFNRYNPSFTDKGAIQKVGSSHGGTDDPLVLTDFDAQGIQAQNGDFLGSSYRATKIEFVNMGFTGDFNLSHDSTNGALAVTTLYKDIKLKIVDTNISDIEGAKYWTTDKDNGSRFSGTASWLGSQNADETFSSDRVYTGSTDLNGEATERLLTRACYGGASPLGVYNGNTTIDYRGETTDNTDVFNFYVASYGHTLNSVSPSCLGTGVLEQQVVLFSDVFLTESNKTIVDAYPAIDTPQKFYDKAKAYLVDNYAGESATIVTRDGNSIDAGSYNVVVDGNVTDAASAFAISGNTLTIKATRFVGNISTLGTTTLSNGAEVIGTFGSSTVLPWEVKNVEATTRLQLYNLTKDSLVVTQKLSGTAGTYVDATGTYDQTEISVGDVIRLRCTCVVGAEAMLPVEITGVATSTGITFSVDQVADEVYNSNAINGSTVSTLTADYSSPMGVDVSDADGTASAKEIYAFFVYSTTTEDGVHLWFGGMRAIDNANYEVVTANSDIKIQNIGSNAVIVSDGRMYRDDGTSILYGEDGDKPISMDSGALVTSIQPQVEAGLNANAKISSINKNSKLIPGLL
jgi:hypothetical protein